MKSKLMAILPALAIALIMAPSVRAEFDYSRPFPLSLLEYENSGGDFIPGRSMSPISRSTPITPLSYRMRRWSPSIRKTPLTPWRSGAISVSDIAVSVWDTLSIPAKPGMTPCFMCRRTPGNLIRSSTVDTSGNFFACTLCLHSTGQGPTGIYVQKSTDGGVSWSPPVIAIDSASAYFEDKQMIVLDKYPGPTYGNIYIAWARFTADLSSSLIYSLSSVNGGASYEPPVRVSEAAGVQWPVPATGPNGDLFIAWFRYFPRGIYMDRSTDMGQTFGSDVLVTSLAASAGEINGRILVFPFPAFVIDNNPISPYISNMYIAYMDDAGPDMDIFFIRSTDNGLDWSTRIRLNDDDDGNGADQFHPWLSVDERGVIHAVFYDRRLDVPDNLLFDLFYTRSTDGGLTWSANERITTVSSNPNEAALAGLIGEYIGLSAWQGQVQMAWTDTRNGNQDVFAGRMDITGINDDAPSLPQTVKLGNPYPNPFNSSIAAEFYSPSERNVTLDVIDILGRRVATLHDGPCKAGANRVVVGWPLLIRSTMSPADLISCA